MIYITGDTHGEFERFGNRYFNADENDTVIICGNFGIIYDNNERGKVLFQW